MAGPSGRSRNRRLGAGRVAPVDEDRRRPLAADPAVERADPVDVNHRFADRAHRPENILTAMVGTANGTKHWRRRGAPACARSATACAGSYGRPVRQAARPPDRREAGADGATRRTPTTATATSPTAPARRVADLGRRREAAPVSVVEEADPAGRPVADEGPGSGPPAAAQSDGEPTLDARRHRSRGGARLPHRAARGRAQDGRLRADLQLRPSGGPGRHARLSRRRTPRPVPERASFEAAHGGCSRSPTPRMPTSSRMNLITHGPSRLPARPARARSAGCDGCVPGSGGTGRSRRVSGRARIPTR